MQFGACIGLDEIIDSHSSHFISGGHHRTNLYIGQHFSDDKNYQAILDCLDGGYEVAKTLIKSIEEYRDLRQEDADRLISYSTKCASRLSHLPSISTYHTTMKAQRHTYQSFEEQAKIIKDSCDTIQPVIDRYSKQVDEIYPNVRFSTIRKHYRTDEMKSSFKRARLPLQKVLDKLEQLRTKEKKAMDAIQNGSVEFENLKLDSTRNAKQDKLEDIQEDIVIEEEIRRKKEAIYVEKATAIFEQCQELEKERLDQIEETLIAFIQVVHPSPYSTTLVTVYEKLLLNIKTQQNSNEDLNYWAKTYGVHTLTSTDGDENQ